MTRLQEKVQGVTKQAIGQMIGDDKLVQEGKEERRQAGTTSGRADQAERQNRERE